jgi:hypothetical protein
MDANQERLRELADECIVLGAQTDDADTVSELLRISYRLLELADRMLPQWENAVSVNRVRLSAAASGSATTSIVGIL